MVRSLAFGLLPPFLWAVALILALLKRRSLLKRSLWNQWIAALSERVVVVEAPERSGALITARMAAEIGRDVWAVPGPLGAETSRGCNRLIADGGDIRYHVIDENAVAFCGTPEQYEQLQRQQEQNHA